MTRALRDILDARARCRSPLNRSSLFGIPATSPMDAAIESALVGVVSGLARAQLISPDLTVAGVVREECSRSARQLAQLR
jgi:hypothetical protein